MLPDGKTVTKVNKTDQSTKNKTTYYYTEVSEMQLVPKYTDHNKNLTCLVFTIGSSNLTVEKTLLLNVDGFQLTDKCSTFFKAVVNDTDVNFSCTYFANPKVVPEWTTQQRSVTIKISSFESEKSNYVSSFEELGNRLYRATLRVKQVTLSDYKAYKMVFSHTSMTEHVVNLTERKFLNDWVVFLV